MKAELYRMVMEDHICPYGLKARNLIERKGLKLVDHKLRTDQQVDEVREKYHVKKTPLVLIDGNEIGGYDDLANYFNVTTLKQTNTTYQPVIALFSAGFLMALAIESSTALEFMPGRILTTFIAVSMCLLAIQKLRDLYSFTNQFITYDLLAFRHTYYAYLYPFLELFAGIGMLAGVYPYITAPIALFIGSIGSISVIKAVYIDKRELKCACVGGDSNVPLGVISLTENIMMVLIAIITFIRII